MHSDLTWYYNYASTPIDFFDGSKLQFVPMLWGTGAPYTGFYKTVKGLLDSDARIKYVLGFNEPDLCGPKDQGGSCVDAKKAASVWQQEIEPLKHHGVKLGAPAVTQGGLWWLQDFYSACDGKCSTDFLPVHYYGDFPGLAGYVGLVRQTYPNMTIWVTEFAIPNVTILESQQFYNQSVDFLDSLEYVTHYSYFGSFRSEDANSFVGSNGTMLNNAGELTDIGAWYLGMSETDIKPESAAATFVSFTLAPLLALSLLSVLMLNVV